MIPTVIQIQLTAKMTMMEFRSWSEVFVEKRDIIIPKSESFEGLLGLEMTLACLLEEFEVVGNDSCRTRHATEINNTLPTLCAGAALRCVLFPFSSSSWENANPRFLLSSHLSFVVSFSNLHF
jgi:hypothetical protein